MRKMAVRGHQVSEVLFPHFGVRINALVSRSVELQQLEVWLSILLQKLVIGIGDRQQRAQVDPCSNAARALEVCGFTFCHIHTLAATALRHEIKWRHGLAKRYALLREPKGLLRNLRKNMLQVERFVSLFPRHLNKPLVAPVQGVHVVQVPVESRVFAQQKFCVHCVYVCTCGCMHVCMVAYMHMHG